jgi:hypothetical protein
MFPLLLLHSSSVYAENLLVQVVDAVSGTAVQDARISCLQEPQSPTAATDALGKAALECEQGQRTIEVFHEEYGKKELRQNISSIPTSLRIRLEPAAAMVIVSERAGEEVTRHVVTAEELKMVPGTFGDPVRALQALPGVARPNVAEGSIVVRGAEGINTGFYVDGMPVPYMFHSFVGRSLIIPAFIDDIEFFPGGMPSKYGEVTQAVVNVRTDTVPVGGTRASLRVDFLDGGGGIEQRLTDRLVLRTGGRYSWVGGLIAKASKVAARRAGAEDYEATYLAPEYWDLFGDLRYSLSDDDSLDILFLSSRDTLVFREARADNDGDGEPDPLDWEDEDLSYDPEHWIDSQFWRMRLKWDHDGAGHDHSSWIAGGVEQQQNLLGSWWLSRQGPYRGRVGGPALVVRRDDRWAMDSWGEGSAVVAGAQLTARWFTAEDFQETFSVTDYSELEDVVTQDDQYYGGVWFEPQWQGELLYLGPGLRGSVYAWDGKTDFIPEPRLSARLFLPDEWVLKGAFGRYSQAPPLERYAQGIGNPDLEIMKAWQASIGTEGELFPGVQIDSSVFGGWMDDLVVRDLEVDFYNDGETARTELQPYYLGVTGIAYGWEALIRILPGQRPWWGWLSLTAARALRVDEEGRSFPGDYDQPISVTAVGAYDLGKEWELSGRVQYTSGQPFTPLYGVYVPSDTFFTPIRGELNSDRYPYYFRVDARVQKKWSRSYTDWTLYLDVYNLTSRRNAFIAFYNYDYTELLERAGIPIVPTFGLEVEY